MTRLAAAAALVLAQSAVAGVILSNGTTSIGIHDQGNLIYQGVGLRYVPTGGEALAPGCPCEGWGVADLNTRKFAKAGESFGDANVVVESFTKDGSSATSVVNAAGIMRVTHQFAASESKYLYRVSVKIENTSANTIHLLYRRAMDWDVPPTTFSEMVTIVTNGAKEVVFTSDNGFADGNPLVAGGQIMFTGEATDRGPSDHGALFDFDFGDLAPGKVKEFVIYYGAAGNENEALNALSQVGAEVYSFGKPNPSYPGVKSDGTPNTFIFGFGGVGGKPVVRVLPDLTLGGLRLVDNGTGQPFGLTARVANAGHRKSATANGVKVNFYDGDPASGGTLLGQQTVASLAPGEYKDVSLAGVTTIAKGRIFAVVDPGNEVLECRELNNQDDAPFAATGAQAAIGAGTDQATYGPQSAALLSAHVTNTGSFEAQLTARLIIEDQNGIGLYSGPAQALGTVPAGGSVDFTNTWNTGSTIVGTYRLRGVVTDAAGAQVAETTAAFGVVADAGGGPALGSTVLTDKPVYEQWGAVRISGRVVNTTVNAIEGPAVALVTVVRSDGTTLYTGTSAIGELYPKASTDVGFTAWLTDENAGDLTVLLTVTGAGGLLTSSTTSFRVERKPTSGLAGFVDVLHPQLFRGEANVCTETVTNYGAAEIAGVTVIHQVVALDSGLVIAEERTLRTMPGNSTMVDTWSVPTPAIGEHACVLSVEVAGENKKLALGGYLVKQPPIRIESEWRVGDKGRLLVLLDKAFKHEDPHDCDHEDHHLTLHVPTNGAARRGAVEARLSDDQGRTVATSHLPAASSDAESDVAVLGFDASGLTIRARVEAMQRRGLIVSVTGDGKTDRYTTGPMTFDCHEHDHHRAMGDFKVVDVRRTSDDHASPEAPTLEAQQAFLEELLKADGWQYTIVTDAPAFARELHHGGYSAYALLSEKVKLPEDLQDELVEAVHRGEGLLVAGDHDNRHNRLDQVLGVSHRGHLSHVAGLTVAGADWIAAGEEAFGAGGHANRIALDGASVVGRYTGATPGDDHDDGHDGHHHDFNGSHRDHDGGDHSDHDPKPDVDVAVTSFVYGQGRSVYAGFDLLAESTRAGSASLFATLLRAATGHVHPDQVRMASDVAIPLTFHLENQGMAVGGQVIARLPVGTRVIAVPNGTVQADGSVVWPYSLAETQTLDLQLLAIFPAGVQSVSAVVQTLSGGAYVDYATVEHSITVAEAPTWESVLTTVDLLGGHRHGHDGYRQCAHELDKAKSAFDRKEYLDSLDHLTDAAQPLKGMTAIDAINLRFSIDELIREVAGRTP